MLDGGIDQLAIRRNETDEFGRRKDLDMMAGAEGRSESNLLNTPIKRLFVFVDGAVESVKTEGVKRDDFDNKMELTV